MYPKHTTLSLNQIGTLLVFGTYIFTYGLAKYGMIIYLTAQCNGLQYLYLTRNAVLTHSIY